MGSSGGQLHGQVLQAVDRQLRPPLQKGPVQLLHKEALASHRLQGPVQNPVSRGLHGQDAHFCLWQGVFNVIRHQAGLDHGQSALPTANFNASSHGAISRIFAAASFTARWFSPVPVRPAVHSSAKTTAGKKKSQSRQSEALLASAPLLRASAAMARLTSPSLVAAKTKRDAPALPAGRLSAPAGPAKREGRVQLRRNHRQIRPKCQKRPGPPQGHLPSPRRAGPPAQSDSQTGGIFSHASLVTCSMAERHCRRASGPAWSRTANISFFSTFPAADSTAWVRTRSCS